MGDAEIRRRTATAVPAALMAVMLVVGSALAGHGHATGGGTFVFLASERLEFQAHDYGAPPLDRGIANARNLTAGIAYKADIVCAFVTTDVIRFGYIIPENESTLAFGIVGYEVVWEITDGGSPGAGNDRAYYNFTVPNTGYAQTCDTDTVLSPMSNVLNGNFTVHEAN